MPETTEQMIEYIVEEIVRRPGVKVDEDTPLVSSGLIDSLALVDILLKTSLVRTYPRVKSNPRTWIRYG